MLRRLKKVNTDTKFKECFGTKDTEAALPKTIFCPVYLLINSALAEVSGVKS